VTIHQFLQDLEHQLPQRLSSLSSTSDDDHCETHIAEVETPHPPPFEFHIYTTEISTKLLNVAQSMFRLAKMENCITPILVKEDVYPSNYDNTKRNNATKRTINSSDGDDNDTGSNGNNIHATQNMIDHEVVESSAESLSRTLKQKYGVSKIDFLLLDHAKHMYLHDLQTLEQCGLVGKGSYVSADNVVFNRLDAYREHMRQLESIGVVETRLEEMCLEYSNNLKDGIGK
jgi:predicted O-methyltransferase YrrM